MFEYKIKIIAKNETTYHTFWAADDNAAAMLCMVHKQEDYLELYKDNVKIADI